MTEKGADGFHTIEEIAAKTYRIDEGGVCNCYLLLGEKKALLIDCGDGIGDIGKTVAALTELPVTLALTHRHCDHGGGRSSFSDYYVHEGDRKLIYKILTSRFASKMLLKMNPDAPKDMKIHKGPYHSKIHFFPDGKSFDLGGRIVRTIHVPGHTKGSVVFVDDATHTMFTGYDVNPYLWLQLPGCTSITEWLPGAKTIIQLADTYTPYCGHNYGLIKKEDIVTLYDIMEKLLAEKPKFKGSKLNYPSEDAPIRVFIAKKNIR